MAGEKQISSVKNTARSFPAWPIEQGMLFHSLAAPHSGIDAEQRPMLAEWNNTEANFPRDKFVHELFETQVERTPNAVALVNSKGAVSYRELDYQANRVAIHLRSLCVGPDLTVGICAQRFTDRVVGLLGIWKAGGAYLPLDAASPKERLVSMLLDSGATVLLMQKALAGRFQFQIPNCREVCLGSLRQASGKTRRKSPPRAKAATYNIAFVIDTLSFNAGAEMAKHN